MDLRDFVRGLFGLNIQKPQRSDDNSSNSKSFIDSMLIENDPTQRKNPMDEREFPLPPSSGLIMRPGFLFGNMLDTFTEIENMFKEVEQSMRDMDPIFQQDFLVNILEPPALPGENKTTIDELEPYKQEISRDKNENLRDLVLKKGYSKPKVDPKDKVDKDLDDMQAKSALDLSDMPLPNMQAERGLTHGSDILRTSTPEFFGKSSFERVYSTHSFKNGRWEGKTVRENDKGKEVTTYYRDNKGEVNETKEFFPHGGVQTLDQNDQVDRLAELPFRQPLSFLDRLFKPRL